MNFVGSVRFPVCLGCKDPKQAVTEATRFNVFRFSFSNTEGVFSLSECSTAMAHTGSLRCFKCEYVGHKHVTSLHQET